MNSLFDRFGARAGALCFAATLLGGLACTDDGMSEESGDTLAETTGDGDGDPGALSYAADIQPIWDDNCTNSGCHQMGGLAEFLDLSGDSYGNVVGVLSTQNTSLQLVEANSSGTSYLVDKLRGTQIDAGGMGGSMPAGANAMPLPEETIMLIEAWIDGGVLP